MEHFAKSWFWRIVSVGLVAGLFYLGHSVSRLADSPVAHAGEQIEVNLSRIGGWSISGAIPVKVQN